MPALPLGPANLARVRLMPPPWQKIATGETPLDSLDDEEVRTGRLKDRNGKPGPRPAFYPQNFIDEQVRRSLNWSNAKIRESALEAIETIRSIMLTGESDSDRLKAAMFFTDRFLGKEVQRVLVSTEDPVENLLRRVLAEPDGLAPHEPSAEERALL